MHFTPTNLADLFWYNCPEKIESMPVWLLLNCWHFQYVQEDSKLHKINEHGSVNFCERDIAFCIVFQLSLFTF